MPNEREFVIPLVEEHVSATKRKVETGRVRVSTHVDERIEVVRQKLERDEVEIERVPMNREIKDMPRIREEKGVTIVPVVEEVLVVEKKLMLVEEIRLRRTRGYEKYEKPVTLRAQRAEVERVELSGETTTTTKPTKE
jgi:stress response protein YsnF